MKYIAGWLAQETKLESIYPSVYIPVWSRIASRHNNFLPFLESTCTSAWVHEHLMLQHQRSPRTGSKKQAAGSSTKHSQVMSFYLVKC